MFIYNVTVNVDDSVADEWLKWMREAHIPAVLKTGFFTKYNMVRVMDDDNNGGKTYSIQYHFNSMDEYSHYAEDFAPALQAEVLNKYRDKFVAFRTILEVID
jgi:hypothetical protein